MNREIHVRFCESVRGKYLRATRLIEALHLNQNYESVNREMLEHVLSKEKLREIRELSWILRDKLHVVNTQLELSGPAQKSTA